MNMAWMCEDIDWKSMFHSILNVASWKCNQNFQANSEKVLSAAFIIAIRANGAKKGAEKLRLQHTSCLLVTLVELVWEPIRIDFECLHLWLQRRDWFTVTPDCRVMAPLLLSHLSTVAVEVLYCWYTLNKVLRKVTYLNMGLLSEVFQPSRNQSCSCHFFLDCAK